MKKLRYIAGLTLGHAIASAAAAQTVIPLPQTFTMSPGGVEMRSGQYYYQNVDVSIGDLELKRTHYGVVQSNGDDWPTLENGIDHNHRIGVKVQRVPRLEGGGEDYDDWLVTVHIGETTYAFKRPYQATQPFVQTGGVKGRSLTWTGGTGMGGTQTYTFTDRDNTVYVFRPNGFVTQPDCGASTPCSYVSTITAPTGRKLTFGYDTDAGTGNSRLRLVTSNLGHAIAFEYSGLKVTKACAVDLAVHYMATGTACPAGVQTAGYSHNAGTVIYTDPLGGSWTFAPNSITRPGGSQPWVSWTTGCCASESLSAVTRQDFADGSWWTYTYGIPGNEMRSTFTGPAGTTVLQFDRTEKYTVAEGLQYTVSSGPSSITDPLGRTILTQYCASGSGTGCVTPVSPTPRSQTAPEGDQTVYTNDSYDAPISAVFKAKPGSGLADRTASVTYAYSIPGGKTKPLTATDARGAVTNYSYDSVHGSVLSEMQPAPTTGAARPLKLYSYVQKYAYVKNASGALVSTSAPLWLPATETVCQTAAGSSTPTCDGAVPQTVTTYEYGADGTAGNLRVRGKVVSADGVSLRTCYGYDGKGNRIFETSPRAGLAVCQ